MAEKIPYPKHEDWIKCRTLKVKFSNSKSTIPYYRTKQLVNYAT